VTGPDVVADYLRRLDAAARELPEPERRELRAEIEEHLRDALAEDDGEAAIREALDRLGEPQEIVAEQQRSAPQRPPRRVVGAQQWTAIVLLLAGGFLMGIGWIVGLVLLWSSRAWSVREKLVGTLLVPGGLATVFFLALRVGGETCTSGGAVRSHGSAVLHSVQRCTGATTLAERVLALALLVFLLVAPIVSAIFLALRAQPLPA
jgi:hypothetical protein